MTHLPADCLPGLLTDWCGPVECPKEGRRGTSCVLLASHATGYTIGNEAGGSTSPVPASSLFLDLRRPEVRDRVARVIAEVLGVPVGATAPRFWTEADERGDLFAVLFGSDGIAHYFTSWRSVELHVPALASIPLDHPDRDILALAAAARWVGEEVRAGRIGARS